MKRLSCFDFDGTVANVPERPLANEDKRAWNGKDWWGSEASLTHPDKGGFYDGSVNEEVITAFKEARADPDTYTILLTGRRGIAAHLVRKVLRDNGLYGKRMIDNPKVEGYFKEACKRGKDCVHENESLVDAHEEYYVGDQTVNNGLQGTYGHKKHVLDMLVKKHKFDIVEIWDDRVDHIDLFKSLGRSYIQEGLAKEVIIHQVYKPKVEGGTVYITHVPVSKLR